MFYDKGQSFLDIIKIRVIHVICIMRDSDGTSEIH